MAAAAPAPVRPPEPWRGRGGPRRWPWTRGLFYLGVGFFVLFALFPFYWVFATSLETAGAFAQGTTGLWPSHLTLQNYVTVFTADHFLQPLANSALVATVTTALTLVLASLAAYALSRLRLRGRGLALGFVLAVAFFPVLAMVGPLFFVFRDLSLLNTYAALVLSYLIYTLPLSIWLLTSFFGQIPREVEEQALVDGATRLQALRKVLLPLAAPGLFTTGILSFILCWNDFVFALSFLETPGKYTVPLAIVNLGQSQYQTFYNLIDASVVVVTVPIAVLVLLAQRRIIAGLTAGSLKG